MDPFVVTTKSVFVCQVISLDVVGLNGEVVNALA